MGRGLVGQFGALVRIAGTFTVVAAGIGMSSGTTGAQAEERRVTAYANCVQASVDREPLVWVKVSNYSGRPIRLIAVEGFSSPRAFDPFFLEAPADELLDIEIPDQASVAVDGRWSGLIGGDGEGLAAGAVVVTSVGALAPLCSTQPQDFGELILTDPIPTTTEERRLQEARYMAETLGQLERWRAYPLLYALLHPDAQAALDLGRLACWYVGQLGARYDPERLTIFSTTVSVAEIEPWTWDVNGETYETAISYDYEQEVGTRQQRETASGNAHLVLEQGVWRWFFGTSQKALDALPETCDLDGVEGTTSGAIDG